MTPLARRNGDVSFWDASLTAPPWRPPLDGDRDADVCIVGGGFTGLWTAYHLACARPELRVVVLERERVGFGASGRNGGWLTPSIAAPRGGDPRARGALSRAMHASVDDALAVCERERIDCDAVAGGVLRVARNAAQATRLRAQVAAARGTPDALVELDAAALAARLRLAGARGATWAPHGVRVQPAKLARGLADAVERRGVRIHEGTAVRELRAGAGASVGRGGAPAAAVADRGTVRAPVVLRCLEGFTAGLRGERRRLLPLTSAMVVTEPLPEPVWAAIGWEGCELLGDAAHAFVYAQRTADGRIALGGRGSYRYGSRTDRGGRVETRTVAWLAARVRTLFPAAATATLDHAWCGVIGVARDWTASVSFDPRSGLGGAGGYVGHGVGAAQLAGRTLRDLVLGEETELTRLPWVDHRARRWEPEPLRWLGAAGISTLYHAADRVETRRELPRTSRLARAADLIAGR